MLPAACRFLADIHCFTLANVLRHPIIIYGDKTAAMSGLAGIYLPLLWDDPAGAPAFLPSALCSLCTMFASARHERSSCWCALHLRLPPVYRCTVVPITGTIVATAAIRGRAACGVSSPRDRV